jgi:hypothetical protein
VAAELAESPGTSVADTGVPPVSTALRLISKKICDPAAVLVVPIRMLRTRTIFDADPKIVTKSVGVATGVKDPDAI